MDKERLAKIISEDSEAYKRKFELAGRLGFRYVDILLLEEKYQFKPYEYFLAVLNKWESKSENELENYGIIIEHLKALDLNQLADIISKSYSQENHSVSSCKTKPQSIWFNVIRPIYSFTGRENELLSIYEKFQTNISAIVIAGIGGIGKTELARKYAYEYANYYSEQAIWINAENLQTIESDFLRLKEIITPGEHNAGPVDLKYLIKFVYGKMRAPWLLVLNNLENIALLDLIPRDLPPSTATPDVLITARLRQWNQSTLALEIIQLNSLNITEATKLLKTVLINQNLQENSLNKLIVLLDGFPLAFQQAASYINEYLSEFKDPILEYLQEFETIANELLDFKYLTDYEFTILTTWKITLGKIMQERNGELAIKILQALSFFPPDYIDTDLLKLLNLGPEPHVNQALSLLKKYLIQGDRKIVSVHRLIQKVIRIDIEDQKLTHILLQKCFDMINEVDNKQNLYFLLKLWIFKTHVSCRDDLIRLNCKTVIELIPKIIDPEFCLRVCKILLEAEEIQLSHRDVYILTCCKLVAIQNIPSHSSTPTQKALAMELYHLKDYRPTYDSLIGTDFIVFDAVAIAVKILNDNEDFTTSTNMYVELFKVVFPEPETPEQNYMKMLVLKQKVDEARRRNHPSRSRTPSSTYRAIYFTHEEVWTCMVKIRQFFWAGLAIPDLDKSIKSSTEKCLSVFRYYR